ncbi:unnamed protein product [Paramecium sonneborni]|uniref:Transmembrane protein n=1 Tax=Paramecium sonneborni TaxID=65129 RepID=A0A8S1PVN7_9CILI|nr:unnamed protein product [Paramecium sonneborni]
MEQKQYETCIQFDKQKTLNFIMVIMIMIVQQLSDYNYEYNKNDNSCLNDNNSSIMLQSNNNNFRSGVFICLIVIEGYLYQFKPNSRHVQFPRMILLILAVLVILYLAITQISHALLDDNGNGKVPIIDPHDSGWYRLKNISRIIEYSTCSIVVIIQILIGYKKKKNLYKTKAIESLIENDQVLITSLEPTISKNNQNQVTQSQMNSQMVNTLESKNTEQIKAIQKLNNNNNNS